VATSGRHFKCALGVRLPFDIGQVMHKSRRWRDGGLMRRQGGVARQMGADIEQAARRQNGGTGNQRRLIGTRCRQDERAPGPGGGQAHRQGAAHRPQLAGQRQLAGKFMNVQLFRPDGQLTRGNQDPQRNRQIEAARLLGQIGRRQIDGDAPRRKIKPAVLQRRPHPLAGFLDFRFRQADQRQRRQAAGQVYLNRYLGCLQPGQGTAF